MKYTQTKDRQSISYFFDKELEDYKQAGIMTIHDMDIDDEQYTQYLAPGIKSQTRFFIAEYNENYVPQGYVDMMVSKITNDFYGIFFDTPEDAKTRLRTYTVCGEVIEGKFLVTPEDQELWVEAVYYVID